MPFPLGGFFMDHLIARHELAMPVSLTSVYSIYHANLHGKARTEKSYPFYELEYVSKSSSPLITVIDGRTYCLNEGQLHFFPPHSHHHGPPSDATVYMITFDVDFAEMDKLCGRVIELDGKQKQMIEQVVATGLRLLEGVPQKGYERGNSIHERANIFELQKFKNLFELFLIDLYLNETNSFHAAVYRFADEEKLDMLISYLKRNIDKPLTLEKLSADTLISVAKIQKLFYEKHTSAPMQYFNQLKIETAIELMCNTTKNFAEIATMLGFSSPAYFSRLFKKKTGVSPSEYIRLLKKNKREAR